MVAAPVRLSRRPGALARWPLVVGVLAAVIIEACGGGDSPTDARKESTEWLVDRTKAANLDFVHVNGMSGAFFEPEIFSPGIALFDYDNDGDLDLYVTQGQILSAHPTSADTHNPTAGGLKDRLFRNDLVTHEDGTRTMHFVDVTESSRIDVHTYGMGVAVGDFDNDGLPDIYRTGLAGSVLLRNNGDGTFTDVTRRSGTGNEGAWGVSASFVDYDRDGWLDLYVGNYLQYSLTRDVRCTTPSGARDYCDPSAYRPARDRLYHNERNGTFRDVTDSALRSRPHGAALGVSTADFNGDGWMDIYVANDRQENDLWMNQRDGTFRNTALQSGSALNGDGRAEASMGVDAGDFDNDGDEDLVITNLSTEGITLYRNDGSGRFEDVGTSAGLRQRSLAHTGFGVGWIDIDNDGWLDVLTVNGAVKTIEALARAGDPFPFAEPKQLFRNQGSGRFEEIAQRSSALRVPAVSRGAAFGDIDNDGDVDVVVADNNGPVRLFMNEIGNRAHWAGFRLNGVSGRNILGTRVAVRTLDGRTIWRRARSDGSYASANDPRVLIGLGESVGIAHVRVTWASGRSEEWSDLKVDRWTTLTEGAGR